MRDECESNESQISPIQNKGERIDVSLVAYAASEGGGLDLGEGDFSWEENKRPQHDDHDP